MTRMAKEEHLISLNQKFLDYFNQFDEKQSKKVVNYRNFLQQEIIKRIDKRIQSDELLDKVKTILKKNKGKLAAVMAVPLSVFGTAYSVGSISAQTSSIINLGINEAIDLAFKGVSSSGITEKILSFITSGLSSFLGEAISATVGIALPIAGFYILIPYVFKLITFLLKKGFSYISKTNKQSESKTPNNLSKGPLLDLICNLSALSIIDELTKELQTLGIKKISFNFEKIINQFSSNKKNEPLKKEEEIILCIAKKNAEKLLKINKKTKKTNKLNEYQMLATTTQLKEVINDLAGPDVNITANDTIDHWLTVVAVLIDKETVSNKKHFFETLRKIGNEKAKISLQTTRQKEHEVRSQGTHNRQELMSQAENVSHRQAIGIPMLNHPFQSEYLPDIKQQSFNSRFKNKQKQYI